MARILASASALPENAYSQAELRDAYVSAAGEALSASDRHLAIFDRAGVASRRLVQPLDEYAAPTPFGERNRRFVEAALDLGGRAARAALERSGCRAEEIGHIIAVTTTGLATPSLDARLAHALGLPAGVKRTPLFGTGCASGAVGLSRASEYLRLFPHERVLLVAAELCSLTFQRKDRSVRNLVASALFADGAAAVVLAGEKSALGRPGPSIVATASHLFPESLDVMGWEFSEEGMHIVLSAEVPKLVLETFRPLVESFLASNGVRLGDIGRWLLHPGGLKVIEAYESALGLGPAETRVTRGVLERFGNLSSATLLVILEQVLAEERPAPGTYGLAAALGPGFAAEFLLLRW